MPDKSVFIISLDTELAWGFILNPGSKVLTLLKSEPEKAREAIDWLLNLFKRYSIPATWAVVGHLFLDSNEWKETIHRGMPQFSEGWLDWDSYTAICNTPLYYGKDIVNKILASLVRHEIAIHSFLHIPFSQCSREVANAEIEQAVKLARRFSITPKSFVFPRDQIGHIELLKANGFEIYRGRQLTAGNLNQSYPIRKLNSAIDKIVAPPAEARRNRESIWEISSSMYFCDAQIPFTLLPRAKIGLNRAIRANKVFHIFLHPWSLLLYSSLVKDLESFLALVARKREEGKLQVMTMGELASSLNQKAREVL